VGSDPLVALAERLQIVCIARGLTVATAESCTGGLVGHLITEVPGSSAYYLGGVISYSDDAKVRELGVEQDLLDHHGAVSAQVARSMATGARQRFGATLGVSVTGIAGPDGGTLEKPVGLTYVCALSRDEPIVRRHQWPGDRDQNKRSSAESALELLIEVAEAGAGVESPGRSAAASPSGAAAREPTRSR
jgi:PncC family amidohydrolase